MLVIGDDVFVHFAILKINQTNFPVEDFDLIPFPIANSSTVKVEGPFVAIDYFCNISWIKNTGSLA
ncbi:MAG: hypothetical protein ACJ71B_11910 [Nitrososphaera sp.]